MISAKVIADSVSPDGVRLTTFEVEFHRFVLAECNTHRVFSRNYQSSRAVPVQSMIDQVRENPAEPIHWGKAQAGMQAEEELDQMAIEQMRDMWAVAAKEAATSAQHMLSLGGHKQVINRILEPFIWTRGVITATEEGFNSFFKLRLHRDAQPEIRRLAEFMADAYAESEPNYLKPEMWHTPYFGDGYWHKCMSVPLETAVKISSSCAAQVSYRKLDDTAETAERIYGRLNFPKNGVYPEDPCHFSPAEHAAMCFTGEKCINNDTTPSSIGGNFQTTSWYQLRKMMEIGVESHYLGVQLI